MKYSKNHLIFLIVFVVALVGFFGMRAWTGQETPESEYTLVDGLLEEAVTFGGEKYLIPPDLLYETGLTAESTPPVNEPKYISIASADSVLANDVFGLSVENAGEHRFYSFQVMNWHEVVNDEWNGTKVAVTHCTLCRSSAVWEREVNGQELTFEYSGLVYNNNTLLRDTETGSLWLQGRGMAVSGELIGTQLNLLPFDVMSWSGFKESHPEGTALSVETGVNKTYERHPYTNYDTAQTIYFPANYREGELSAKLLVDGVVIAGESYAVPQKILEGFGVFNKTVGGQDVVAFWGFEDQATRFYSSVVDEQLLTFFYDFDAEELTDDQTGSLWDATGRAIEGELEGTQLDRIPSVTAFWFCLSALYPDVILEDASSL